MGFQLNLTPSGTGGFKTKVATHYTHTKDVWHMRIELLSRVRADTTKIYSWYDHTFDSPPLSEQDNPLFHDWSESFTFNIGAIATPVQFLPAYVQITNCC